MLKDTPDPTDGSARRTGAVALPSIKGSTIHGAIEDISKLLETGVVSLAQAERFLTPDDLALLDRE